MAFDGEGMEIGKMGIVYFVSSNVLHIASWVRSLMPSSRCYQEVQNEISYERSPPLRLSSAPMSLPKLAKQPSIPTPRRTSNNGPHATHLISTRCFSFTHHLVLFDSFTDKSALGSRFSTRSPPHFYPKASQVLYAQDSVQKC